MFDYQAGEKFKLTLIMVGMAGLMAGMFFTMLLMPTPGPDPHKHRAHQKGENNPDLTGAPINGRGLMPAAADAGAGQQSEAAPGAGAANAATPSNPVDTVAAMNLIESWLPSAWDMSCGSARKSQAKAIEYMTPECASAYKRNVWTDELAVQIEQSGLQSQFTSKVVKPGPVQADGSMVVFVEGQQVLQVPGAGQKIRPVHLEYLLKNTADGVRIAGISEGSPGG